MELSLKNLTCCLIVNINSYAGGASPFEKAEFNDGKLDIILLKKLWIYMIIGGVSRIFPRCYKWISRFLPVFQAHSIEICDLDSEFVQLDGEDITDKFKHRNMEVLPSGKVLLLDLRRPPFELF
ncbi:hypothetical protein ACFL5V_11610 [Fibrobacterota bacterium]